MYVRIGYFFALVGACVLFIFSASYLNEDPQFEICLGGLLCFALGIVMIIRNRRTAGEAERFRYLRKLRARKKKD